MKVANCEIVNDIPMSSTPHLLTEKEIAENYVTLDEFHQHLQSLIDQFYHHTK